MSSSPPIADARRPLAPRLVVSFIAALSMLLGPLAFTPAQAAEVFSIEGVVSAGGDPLDNLLVELQIYNEQDEVFQTHDWANTDADGAYLFEDVEAGTYRVRAHGTGNFVTTISAEFDLTADRELSELVLPIGGSMSGTVTDATSSDPIEYATVEAFPFDGTTIDRFAESYYTNTDAEGDFTLEGLPAGDFKVEIRDFDETHIVEYYDGAADIASAETVSVAVNEDTPLREITLDRGASFTGVLASQGGGRVEAPSIGALRMVDGEPDWENAYPGRVDEETGVYSIGGLPTGDYKIRFGANSYFEQFYNDKATVEAADSVSIAAGVRRDLGTTSLEKTASLSGSVENAEGAPLGEILVEAFPVVDGVIASESTQFAYTESDGTFSMSEVKAVHAGTYRLLVQDGQHVYEDQYTADFTVAGGEAVSTGVTVLSRAPVVVPPVDPPVVTPPVVAPPAPPAPPVLGPPAPVAKKAASISISAKGGKKKATLTITVKAPGVKPTGKVTIKLGSKTLKNVRLKNGKAKVTLTKQKKGKRTYKVIYAGDSRVKAKTVNSKKVTIK